jgi:hypothetical protein
MPAAKFAAAVFGLGMLAVSQGGTAGTAAAEPGSPQLVLISSVNVGRAPAQTPIAPVSAPALETDWSDDAGEEQSLEGDLIGHDGDCPAWMPKVAGAAVISSTISVDAPDMGTVSLRMPGSLSKARAAFARRMRADGFRVRNETAVASELMGASSALIAAHPDGRGAVVTLMQLGGDVRVDVSWVDAQQPH